MTVRNFVRSDLEQILRLLHDTVRKVNIQHYSKSQVEAWAPKNPSQKQWQGSLSKKIIYVAEDHEQFIGFAELEADGHIDRFYVHWAHLRRGVGRLLLRALEARAVSLSLRKLRVESSVTARPFFAAMGFRHLHQQTVSVRGIKMTNHQMEKSLTGPMVHLTRP